MLSAFPWMITKWGGQIVAGICFHFLEEPPLHKGGDSSHLARISTTGKSLSAGSWGALGSQGSGVVSSRSARAALQLGVKMKDYKEGS